MEILSSFFFSSKKFKRLLVVTMRNNTVKMIRCRRMTSISSFSAGQIICLVTLFFSSLLPVIVPV